MLPLSSTVKPLGWFILASLSLPSTWPDKPSGEPARSFGLLSALLDPFSEDPSESNCLDIIQEASYAKNNMHDNFTVLKYKLSCCSEGSVTDI